MSKEHFLFPRLLSSPPSIVSLCILSPFSATAFSLRWGSWPPAWLLVVLPVPARLAEQSLEVSAADLLVSLTVASSLCPSSSHSSSEKLRLLSWKSCHVRLLSLSLPMFFLL